MAIKERLVSAEVVCYMESPKRFLHCILSDTFDGKDNKSYLLWHNTERLY